MNVSRNCSGLHHSEAVILNTNERFRRTYLPRARFTGNGSPHDASRILMLNASWLEIDLVSFS